MRVGDVFNLKQMAQTVAYLQDHELLDYAVLSEKAAEASAHFNELSARIKAAETRMAEIAVLREHIVNYAKSRDTYVAYRKAGTPRNFLQSMKARSRSTRPQKIISMDWASRSCPPSRR